VKDLAKRHAPKMVTSMIVDGSGINDANASIPTFIPFNFFDRLMRY